MSRRLSSLIITSGYFLIPISSSSRSQPNSLQANYVRYHIPQTPAYNLIYCRSRGSFLSHMVGFNSLFFDQHVNRVSQLNFVTRAWRGFAARNTDVRSTRSGQQSPGLTGRHRLSVFLHNAHHWHALTRCQRYAFTVNHTVCGHIRDRFNHNLAISGFIKSDGSFQPDYPGINRTQTHQE